MRLAAVAAVALVAAGGALAYYRVGGGGSGGASIGSPSELSIVARIPATGLLRPGATGEVDATITNPNPFSVRVNSLVLGGGGIVVDGSHADCDASVVHFTTQTNAGAGWAIPPKVGATDGTLDLELANALSMDASASNACQGATFTVSLATGP